MKVSFITLGCKVNQYESQAMLADLLRAGFTACDDHAQSDLIVVNSCTVTAVSDRKVRQALRHARRENPNAVIVLTGCMPQAFPEVSESLTEADVVLGNSNRSALLSDVQKFLNSRQRVIDITPHGNKFESIEVDNFYERTRAFVKIEDGCNRFCSYCIIPYARGRVRSKPLEDLKHELRQIAANGYREVVLTGINLSAYGQELGLSLCDAVEAACAQEGIERVRLGSLEPEQLGPEVIQRLSKQKKLCPQFHLSLQSGCAATLKRMNRHYTPDEYRTIVQNLRSVFPNAAITTDIMVGFPGETEEEFSESLAFEKEIGFAKVHVFIYSRRPGTPAAKAANQVPPQVGEERSKRMIAAAAETRHAFFEQQIAKVEPVLFERECEDGVYEGYTENYTPVRASSKTNLSGKIRFVTIKKAEKDYCVGELA
ncbi:MAG: (Dimethylallyl)adenosine tRNA methylthiotransferase MiaB [Thermocaproicibacter melissae]|jgi:threonylcarbamoyladenosine tRNA methylthiotransferase MtaB|uniref:tRNA (N(6)-L-threonylcarbamoyladenosine(37)-C(2))- methylthiotransferase MtaB n=1 Tax=Thermocaproicibacter melissae TaxID=2966552 RepID=UPI0024B1682D|nr:tRNA (N(6)-L-threonylcarbamoyladenosine(37)-C(2))-methylthiotransferase MtaB [Thermocaproicibacter melissae]WBY64853.1 tRNA (N(6)-L-threonylcarbamoyladenosine(37)-C(2))-methylthiotransferase MtaB [Thermocaproicibacter melissae]